MTTTILPVTPGLAGARNRLFNDVFAARRSEAAWQHIYDAAPDGAAAVLAWDETSGEALAHYGATFHRATARGEPLRVGTMRDACTRPSARNHGRRSLIAETAQAFFDAYTGEGGAPVLYGFPNGRHYRLGKLVLAYDALPPARGWRLTLDRSTERRPDEGRAVRRVHAFDAAFDACWAETAAPRRDTAVIHDSRFLAWRFPLRDTAYAAWGVWRFPEERLLGYCVVRPDARERGTVWLADFCLPADRGDARFFWTTLAARLRSDGVARVLAWHAPAMAEGAFFADNGFVGVDVPRDTVPTWRVFSPAGKAFDSARFAYTPADSDLI